MFSQKIRIISSLRFFYKLMHIHWFKKLPLVFRMRAV